VLVFSSFATKTVPLNSSPFQPREDSIARPVLSVSLTFQLPPTPRVRAGLFHHPRVFFSPLPINSLRPQTTRVLPHLVFKPAPFRYFSLFSSLEKTFFCPFGLNIAGPPLVKSPSVKFRTRDFFPDPPPLVSFLDFSCSVFSFLSPIIHNAAFPAGSCQGLLLFLIVRPDLLAFRDFLSFVVDILSTEVLPISSLTRQRSGRQETPLPLFRGPFP